MKSLIKKIPPIKKICDERDEYQQSMLDAQSVLARLHRDYSNIENEMSVKTNELERVLKVYNEMEVCLHYERQLVAEKADELEQLYLRYNEKFTAMEAELQYERQLKVEKADELEKLYNYERKLIEEILDELEDLYHSSISYETFQSIDNFRNAFKLSGFEEKELTNCIYNDLITEGYSDKELSDIRIPTLYRVLSFASELEGINVH